MDAAGAAAVAKAAAAGDGGGGADVADAGDAGRSEVRPRDLLESHAAAPGFSLAGPFPLAGPYAVPGPPAEDGGGYDWRLSGDALPPHSGPAGPLPGRRSAGRAPVSARLRYRTGVRAAALLGILALVLGGCFWWQVATGGAQVVALSKSAPAADEAAGQEAVATSTPPEQVPSDGPGSITVHVAGAVARPGVVQLPAGSRVHDAITAAGGATNLAEPDRLNLAAVLEDGQKILVPARGDPDTADPVGGGTASPGPGAGAGAGGTGPGGGGGRINLNTAGIEELGTLPRVGPVLAQRIVDWRRQHGRFKTVQELDAVDGIGPKLLEALLPLVGV
ncbi:competence protein ComEA [Arthrobacter oryzae]|uniref:Competence protein ComEA n=1 Tax=Arthrobacter oryzae TaxID=409290 RepID=A0A495FLF6_9MICC|nr:competence protein ComEA [Arthrobacter oryzae]